MPFQYAISSGKPIPTRTVIFVEGKDDQAFIDSILTDFGGPQIDISIVEVDGKPNISSALRSFRLSTAYRKIKNVVLIRDADDDFEKAVEETHKAFLAAFGIVLGADGWAIDNGRYFGYFLLPNHKHPGDLDTLCLETVSDTDIGRMTADYFNAILSNVILDSQSKRQVQIYLASCAGPLSRGAGYGFRQNRFNKNHPSLQSITQFLTRVVELSN